MRCGDRVRSLQSAGPSSQRCPAPWPSASPCQVVLPPGPAPALTWLHGAHDGPAAPQHRLVDGLLVWGELAIGGERARDVRSEAVIFTAHVEHAARRVGMRLVGHPGAPVPPQPRFPPARHLRPLNQRLLATWPVQTAVWGPPTPLSPHGAQAVKDPGAPREAPAPEQEGWGNVAAHTPHPHGPRWPGPWMPGCGDALREVWRYPQAPPATWPPHRHSNSATSPQGPPCTQHGHSRSHRAMLVGAGWDLRTDAPA